MRTLFAITAAATVSVAALGAASSQAAVTAMVQDTSHIDAALANPDRSEEQVADDASRKPAEMLVFAEVQPGDDVAEYIPGGGYFTRIFSKAVGDEGRVYTLQSGGPRAQGARDLAADAAYGNITYLEGPLAELAPPEPVDLVWTSQNYHDIPADSRPAMNATILGMLEPGGVYVVLDHSALTGSGDEGVALHRIDQQIVRDEVTAVGFEFVGEDMSLSNPDDPRTATVFSPDIRGDTDQFVLKFRKPE